MNRPRKTHLACACALFFALATLLEARLEPPLASLATASQDSSSKTDKPNKKKYSHVNDFLIRGSVFNEKALSFPDVELRIRKEGEKKHRWETYTNSRGEFAVRVPQGSNYEILVHAKGYADQTRSIDAKGAGNESVVFRMQPVTGETK